ncbi:MAG TPA: hypothetical protein VF796_11595 [Humisphaera sp.]
MPLVTAPIILELTAGMPETEDDPVIVRLAHLDEPGDVKATLGVHFGRHWTFDRVLVPVGDLDPADAAALGFAQNTGARVARVAMPEPDAAAVDGDLTDTPLGAAVVAAVQALAVGQSLLVLVPRHVEATAVEALVRRALRWRSTWQPAESADDLRTVPHPL